MLDKLNSIKDALDSIEDFVRNEVDVIGAEHLVGDYKNACPHGFIKVDGVCQPIQKVDSGVGQPIK